jgi:hypothetical protein
LASNGPGRIYAEKSALWIQFRVGQSPDDYVTSRLTKGKPAEHALTWQAADQVELAIAKDRQLTENIVMPERFSMSQMEWLTAASESYR